MIVDQVGKEDIKDVLKISSTGAQVVYDFYYDKQKLILIESILKHNWREFTIEEIVSKYNFIEYDKSIHGNYKKYLDNINVKLRKKLHVPFFLLDNGKILIGMEHNNCEYETN